MATKAGRIQAKDVKQGKTFWWVYNLDYEVRQIIRVTVINQITNGKFVIRAYFEPDKFQIRIINKLDYFFTTRNHASKFSDNFIVPAKWKSSFSETMSIGRGTSDLLTGVSNES